MRTQYLHDTTVYDNTYAARVTSATSEGVYIFTATGRKKCNGGHRTIKKGVSTDPKKHFEVIDFILGHFVNFLVKIYQENFLDVSSPLNDEYLFVKFLFQVPMH